MDAVTTRHFSGRGQAAPLSFDVRRILTLMRTEMAFKNLKITYLKAEGKCSRSKVGTTFYIRDAKLEILPWTKRLYFCLRKYLAAYYRSNYKKPGRKWSFGCPGRMTMSRPAGKVIFKIEEERSSLPKQE